MGGLKARHAHDRRNHEVGFRVRRAGNGAFNAVDNINTFNAGLAETVAELRGQFLCCQRHHLRTPAHGLCVSFFKVPAGSQRSYGVAIWKLLNDGERALSNGAGRTENGKSFQWLEIVPEWMIRQNEW